MGRVTVAGADVVVITDDDPHDEDPATIRRHVMVGALGAVPEAQRAGRTVDVFEVAPRAEAIRRAVLSAGPSDTVLVAGRGDRKSTRLNSSHVAISYAVFCLKKKKKKNK